MRQTQAFRWLGAFFIISLTAFSATAQANAAAEKREAQAWLARIQAAAHKLNYSGTFVYQQANLVRTSRITHVVVGNREIEKLEILDGQPREFIRNGDEITCYIPDTKTVLIEKRVTPDVFPALLSANPADLTSFYHVKLGGSGRVAGRPSRILLLEPKDKLRYGYKLWADQSKALLLRAQTVNERGEIVEQISFSQIEIGNIPRSRVRTSFPNVQGWHVENAVMSQVDLSGWAVKSVPPGFRKIREIKRLVTDSSAGGQSAPLQREVSQIVFSDGLAAISVFIEPGNPGRAEGSMQQGAVNIIGKRQGDFWLTIVGEVPSAAVRQVANSIELNKARH